MSVPVISGFRWTPTLGVHSVLFCVFFFFFNLYWLPKKYISYTCYNQCISTVIFIAAHSLWFSQGLAVIGLCKVLIMLHLIFCLSDLNSDYDYLHLLIP